MVVEYPRICPNCKGRGVVGYPPYQQVCPLCGGSGIYYPPGTVMCCGTTACWGTTTCW